MNKAITFVAFLAGAAVGVFAGWKYATKVHNDKLNEEIESVKTEFARYYQQKANEPEETVEEIVEEKISAAKARTEEHSVAEYTKILSKESYTNYSDSEKRENAKPVENDPIDRPYIISSDDFGELDYIQIGLTYFADGVLADDDDEIVDDIDEIVGLDNLKDFEDDVVHIRNDAKKCDYEVIKDPRTYREFIRSVPYKAEYE